MTSKKLLHGYLDSLAQNMAVLDEALALARKMGKSKKAGDRHAAIQALKVVRDLAEVRNATLLSIKAHILGRDETGTVKEPANVYSGNAEVMFERDFKHLLEPWTLEDLKLECEDCGKESEEVSTRTIETGPYSSENVDLCDKCYAKRTVKEEESANSESGEPISNQEAMNPLAERQGTEDDIDLKEAVTDTVRNTIKAIVLDDRSSAEKVKMLEEFKAHLVTIGYNHASGPNIEPGVALLDKEIERLRAEAGKGQDAAGKPVTILPP